MDLRLVTHVYESTPIFRSRKFTVDGKRFRWKHINGLWQVRFSYLDHVLPRGRS